MCTQFSCNRLYNLMLTARSNFVTQRQGTRVTHDTHTHTLLQHNWIDHRSHRWFRSCFRSNLFLRTFFFLVHDRFLLFYLSANFNFPNYSFLFWSYLHFYLCKFCKPKDVRSTIKKKKKIMTRRKWNEWTYDSWSHTQTFNPLSLIK